MSRATLGSETLAGGYMAVHDRIMDKKSLPRIQMANIIQDHSVTPTSAGTYTIDERQLIPVPFLAFQTFNPRDFEAFWPFANSTDGDLMSRELPLAARVAFIQQIAMLVGEFLEDGVWQATTSTGASVLQDKWNGIVTRAAADANVLKVTGPVALDATNVLDKIAATRDRLLSSGGRGRSVWNNQNCKIFTSHTTGDLVRENLEAKTYKGKEVTDAYELMFQGREIVTLQGIPDDTILITRASSDVLTSNLHVGFDWQYDTAGPVIEINRYRPESELFFFKVLMQADTNYTWSEEIGFYQA